MSSESAKPASDKQEPPLHSGARFLVDSIAPEKGRDLFDVVESRLVRIEVDGFVWIKRGSLIAYYGDLKFRREQVLQTEGLKLKSGPFRSAAFREVVPLARVEGKGCLYISDDGNRNQVVRLESGSINVVAGNLLAFDPSLTHEVRVLGGAGLLAGGIFLVRLTGIGLVAVSFKGDPLTMRVTPEREVFTDPAAVVAWNDPLWPSLKTDLSIGTLLAHGGGEAFQLAFRGDGYVIVHARSGEEARRSGLVKRIKSTISKILPI